MGGFFFCFLWSVLLQTPLSACSAVTRGYTCSVFLAMYSADTVTLEYAMFLLRCLSLCGLSSAISKLTFFFFFVFVCSTADHILNDGEALCLTADWLAFLNPRFPECSRSESFTPALFVRLNNVSFFYLVNKKKKKEGFLILIFIVSWRQVHQHTARAWLSCILVWGFSESESPFFQAK